MSGIRPQPWHPARGFTLIEISIVLFIVGLVMSGIVALVNAMVANRQIESTRTKQEAIKTALISFIARNSKLPCPALAILPESNANEGVADCTISPSGAAPNQVITGTVPWVSLGLTREASLDAYANRFTYQVVLGATSLTSVTVSGMTGRITVHSAGPGVPGKPPTVPTGNQTNDCSASGATVNPCAGVAVIVSHGKDGYGAYTRSGSRIPFDSSVTGNDAKENVFDLSDLTKPPDSRFVVKDYSGTDANPFDDIVMVLTTNDLLAPLLVAGTLKDYRATVNNTFDRIKNAIVMNAIKSRTVSIICSSGSCSPRHSSCSSFNPCGSPSFQYPIPAPGVGNTVPTSVLDTDSTKDAWGTSITYTRPLATITSTTTANDTVFTLRSNGPDGTTGGAGNADDFTVSVTAAEIIGLIARTGL